MQCANNNTKILILSHHAPHWSSHHNLHNPRQRHRDLLFRRTSRHHQGPASHLHHLNHHYHIIAALSSPLQWNQSWFCVAGLLCRTRTTRMESSHQNLDPTDRYIWLPMACIRRWEINQCFLLSQIIILSNMGIPSTGETMGPH